MAAGAPHLAECQPRVPVSDLESLRSRAVRQEGAMRNCRKLMLSVQGPRGPSRTQEGQSGRRESSQKGSWDAEILM